MDFSEIFRIKCTMYKLGLSKNFLEEQASKDIIKIYKKKCSA